MCVRPTNRQNDLPCQQRITFCSNGNGMITTKMTPALDYGQPNLARMILLDAELPNDVLLVLKYYPELRSVSCEFKHGALILNGTVSSFYLKQVCQEALRNIAAELLVTIDNRLQVSGS
jgi:hypothetical protein